jgi:hypothetical protein
LRLAVSVSAQDTANSRPSTARVVPVAELRSNVIMLAKLAKLKLMKIPVATTASEPNGVNGPLMPELKEHVPDAERCLEFNTFDRTSQTVVKCQQLPSPPKGLRQPTLRVFADFLGRRRDRQSSGRGEPSESLLRWRSPRTYMPIKHATSRSALSRMQRH